MLTFIRFVSSPHHPSVHPHTGCSSSLTGTINAFICKSPEAMEEELVKYECLRPSDSQNKMHQTRFSTTLRSWSPHYPYYLPLSSTSKPLIIVRQERGRDTDLQEIDKCFVSMCHSKLILCRSAHLFTQIIWTRCHQRVVYWGD